MDRLKIFRNQISYKTFPEKTIFDYVPFSYTGKSGIVFMFDNVPTKSNTWKWKGRYFSYDNLKIYTNIHEC